ncbi:MAG: hypothetical protein JJU29_18325 [Verrucomicrobia bacterium]|nr:hypothetical protein [Verrucomicrobiota bacterium]
MHTLIHAVAAARHSHQQKRWTFETRIAFHCVGLALILTFATAHKIFDTLYLTPFREARTYTPPALELEYHPTDNSPTPVRMEFWEEDDVWHFFRPHW